METTKSNKAQYLAPQVELIFTHTLSLLGSLSAYGDIEDYKEGGEYTGEYTDPLD